MLRGVLLCFALAAPAVASAEPQVAGPTNLCTAIEVPQQDAGFSVIGTFAGQTREFRVTVDGKPLPVQPYEANKETKVDCAYTS